MAGSGTLPLDRRRISFEMSAEGGGAITAGAGMDSFEFRDEARSGAETGGGITASLAVCTGALLISRLTLPAGGITLAAIAGVTRDLSRRASGAGATIAVLNDGAVRLCSRLMFGAGGITAGPRAGATRVWSRETFGDGGITVALKFGATMRSS